jgi:hypothetical protein
MTTEASRHLQCPACKRNVLKRHHLLLIFLWLCGMPLTATADDDRRTVGDALLEYSDKVGDRLLPRFQFAGIAWPPDEVTLVATKDTRLLELWARVGKRWQHVRDYRIKGMSGTFGPKLREGDLQVPEGFYRITYLNPNSRFHLSLKLDYPNRYDRQQAEMEGRTDLGGDIFIHGKNISTGCLAVGDNAVEELFVMTALLGKENVSVIISPRDYRFRPLESYPDQPSWVNELHAAIAGNLQQFPLHEK